MHRHLVVILETAELIVFSREFLTNFLAIKNRMAEAFSGAMVQCNESSKRMRFGVART